MMFTPFAFIQQPGESTTYQIFLSEPGNDDRVCAVGPDAGIPFYTTNITFQVGSIIYEDSDLNTPFRGGRSYYSTYSDTEAPYDKYIRINNDGSIELNGACK